MHFGGKKAHDDLSFSLSRKIEGKGRCVGTKEGEEKGKKKVSQGGREEEEKGGACP